MASVASVAVPFRPGAPRAPAAHADMGGSARARWVAVGLGVLGVLCAALGVVMILLVPSLIKQQVLKVSDSSSGGEGRRVGHWRYPSHHLGGPGSPRRLGGLSHPRPRGLTLAGAEVWPGCPSFDCCCPDLQPFYASRPVTVPSELRAVGSWCPLAPLREAPPDAQSSVGVLPVSSRPDAPAMPWLAPTLPASLES